MRKEVIYTRNLPPLQKGDKLSSILIYNHQEEELDLHMLKTKKVYITIPSFTNQSIVNELSKLEAVFEQYKDIHFYLLSNEPVFTQKRLTKSRKFKVFKLLSDFKNRDFARHTGTYIYEISALVKSIFVVDDTDTIRFVKYYEDLYSNIDANEVKKYLDKLL
ncbi:MAG: hypothetical protein ACK5KR_04500 [Breznakia sp.]